MLIIPAIDIQEGSVVRLTQGVRDKKVYSRDPVKTAKHWARQGAKWIHVVDLDGAAAGKPQNLEAVRDIVSSVDLAVEFGGGVRSKEAIKKVLDLGVQRVVLGTRAADDKNFLRSAFKEYKDKVIVSIDAKAGRVLTKGWKNQTRLDALDFAFSLKSIGFKQMIYTDVARDGTLKGPAILEVKRILKETGIGMIASGGVSSLDDLHRLRVLEKQGLVGVIIGKALYEGRFTLTEALKFS